MHLLLAFADFERELAQELSLLGCKPEIVQGRLFAVTALPHRPIWAQVVGSDAQILPVTSIGEAVKALRSLGKRWACASQELHRRSQLIQEQTFRVKTPEIEFLQTPPQQDWGLWALLEQNLMIAAPRTDSVLPLGEATFAENDAPPSRAYLKLWELCTLHGVRPAAGSKVLDMGACPGGWTWVLANMGLHVVAVDKAPLAPKVAKMPGVQFLKKDAFALKPEDVGPIDWVFSDLICYPERLLELVDTWRAGGVRNFVCTIKYQGSTDWPTTKKLAAFQGSRIIHLCANKHEVTWVWSAPSSGE